MDMFPDTDQQQLIGTVDEFCSRRFPIETVRALAGRPVDDTDWRALAELGCFGLGLPAEAGGFDAGVVGELLVVREIGRHLVPGPIIPTILAAHVLSTALPSVAADVAEGRIRVALAEPFRSDDATPRHLLSDFGDGLVLAVGNGQWSVYPTDAWTEVTPVQSLDPSTRLATANFAGGEPLLSVDDASLQRRADVLVAAAMCGVAVATTAASVEYAKNRIQFGQPIGSFQAVKHRCAEMAVRTEAAYSQTAYAGLVFDEDGPDAEFQTAAARLVAYGAAGDNCADNIQNHGGIGFTEECDAHLYLRRWRALDRMLGDRFSVADRLAALQAAQ
ncbi:acyl-CoA dehydrogenase family protein [[Mycobacterium] vasticus]|uniref:Acyl-CoA dehydrogenase family protein n=1 Tax=[Mycobacterium] vasticus TaxID=2875777 RepID=A0ABU5Z1E2_9MYCO|nr:acyl-CoA dehydrogenase family protein [Mycolicibacter sp. MYC017]MEB3070725.1 acyl-CoA dehydrogenase family protein [Mycolicibacter sp. MYC017]